MGQTLYVIGKIVMKPTKRGELKDPEFSIESTSVFDQVMNYLIVYNIVLNLIPSRKKDSVMFFKSE